MSRMSVQPLFSSGRDPLKGIKWAEREVTLQGAARQVVTVTAPEAWSMTAVTVFASHYLRVVKGVRETHFGQAIARIADTISAWALADGYVDAEAGNHLRHELAYMLVYQMWSPNSPVWYNVGTVERPQISACYIQHLSDAMDGDDGIIALQSAETRLFRRGSGTGTNHSNLRPEGYPISVGGTASGPVSFMRGFDATAGAIKSGGSTRRAAKMVILNDDHPDIEKYVDAKPHVERMAWDLVDAGHSNDYNGPTYTNLALQNANHSVGTSDAFMQAVADDALWTLQFGGVPARTIRARELWARIVSAAHICGDPGLQFRDTINAWHTSPSGGPIVGSNPCQPDFATVLTPDGVRTFADISEGSTIWSGKRWTKVLKKWMTGVKKVVAHQTTAGVFVGTGDHKVISEGVRVRAEDAITIDAAQGPLAGSSLAQWDAAVVMDGWVLGDGSVHKASNDLVYLCIGANDGDIHAALPTRILKHRPGLQDSAWEVETTISAEELPMTYARRIPARFRFSTPLIMRSFLRGLYSANGSVVRDRITLKAASFDVIQTVQEMLSALGIPSYFTSNKGKAVTFSNGTYQCRDSYDLNITRGRRAFAELIGFVQQYKTEKLNAMCASVAPSNRVKTSFTVNSRTDLGDFPVYDITVEDEDHTYWTGGLLVSNCAEFVYIDDSACNLAAHNLRQYQRKAQHPYAVRTHDENPVLVNTLDTDALRHAVGVSILVQDMLVSRASYPTAAIEINSLKYRPLGMGYANLGALLMSLGLGYDTDAGRALAGAITSFVCAEAYRVSQQLTQVKGVSFAQNADDGHAMRRVLGQHAKAAHKLVEQAQRVVADTSDTTRTGYTGQVAAYAAGLAIEAHGVWVRVANAKDLPRNGQATLLAPTGTSGLAMDCDTTGIEPDYALVKHKRLAGGGFLKIVNRTVKDALTVLGYTSAQISAIIAYVEAKEKIEGAPGLDPQHLPVFDCAGRCAEMTDEPGVRYLIPHAHIRMMAAAQPFLSGAISKTVNTPYETTLEEISALYSDAHALGLKCIAIYRDGSKANQPLCGARPPRFNHAHPHVVKTRDAIADALGLPAGQSLDELRAAITKLRADKATGDLRAMCSVRRKLPAERQSVCKSFSVGAHDGYVHAGLYPDGTLGEIFVRMSKMGSTVSGLLDAWATMFSLALQYGAPLEVLCEKGTGSVFQPSGFTGDALRSASSPVDYVSRWLMSHSEFLPPEEPSMAPEGIHETHAEATQPVAAHKAGRSSLTEGPVCSVKGCGGTTRRSGACYVCESCGVTSGCG